MTLMSGCMRFLPVLFFLILCSCASAGVYHDVRPGQTLYRISQVYGVSTERIKRANGIANPSQLKAGTRLYIPDADRVRYVPSTVPKKTVKTPAPKTVKKPIVKPSRPAPPKKVVRPQSKPVIRPPVTVQKPSPSKATAARKGTLSWPLKGRVYRSFSTKKGGATGLEIAVRSGTSVQAAAPGRVIYSDDGISGFGHLVILQHDNDLFTIYGFNQKTLVRSGSFVSKGQKIALSGTPPKGGPARLHFEVRRGKKPVNPILYLP